MLSRKILNRFIVFGFMVLIGFCLARAIYIGSFFGILLALTSLAAAIYFLYLVVKGKEMLKKKENL